MNLTLAQYLEKALHFAWIQVPNWKELSLSASIKSQVEPALEEILTKYVGTDPFNRMIVGDAVKMSKTVISISMGLERGGTGYKYTKSHVFADLFKLACKPVTIYSFGQDFGPCISNYVCEVPGMYAIRVDDEFMNTGIIRNTSYFQNLIAGLNIKNVTISVLQSSSKIGGAHLAIKTVLKPIDPYLVKATKVLSKKSLTLLNTKGLRSIKVEALSEAHTMVHRRIGVVMPTSARFKLLKIKPDGNKFFNIFCYTADVVILGITAIVTEVIPEAIKGYVLVWVCRVGIEAADYLSNLVNEYIIKPVYSTFVTTQSSMPKVVVQEECEIMKESYVENNRYNTIIENSLNDDTIKIVGEVSSSTEVVSGDEL